MSYLDQIRGVLAKGHPDTAIVGLPIAMIRQIARDLEAAGVATPGQLGAATPAAPAA